MQHKRKYERANLDRWITLKSPTRGTPTYEIGDPAYTVEGIVPAQIEMLSGRDLYQAQQANSLATHRIAIDFFPGLASDWLLDWDGKELQIDGVPIELGRQEFHEIMCISKE